MTDAEKNLWRHLRNLPVENSHFRRQATIGPYFADFACHDRRVVIEVDGGQHGEARHMLHDEKRTKFLEAKGYRVLRFWNNDVLSNIDGVKQIISDVLAEPPPTPDPSPPRFAREEGDGGTARAEGDGESARAMKLERP
jgi:very-short-patch-repair endonuclease